MKNRHRLFLVLVVVLGNGRVAAGDAYRWTDETGGVHMGDTSPEGAEAALVYRQVPGDRVFQWQDETGQVHFSDVLPAGTAKPREILLEPLAEPLADPDEYSIVRQAERMAESRRQREEERLARAQAQLEHAQLTRELAILHMQEQIRTRGYGPRPDIYPYAYRYDYYW